MDNSKRKDALNSRFLGNELEPLEKEKTKEEESPSRRSVGINGVTPPPGGQAKMMVAWSLTLSICTTSRM
jgi:hypothetical protein